ncbi:hypothetical protein AURDEDRAFT_185675 [Auricularia subglabra TFB-10046 SS5]|nr:hypothetical protein AURDEDRAFT_185675 [Auricularia subglabra TFB-10046 SS5]
MADVYCFICGANAEVADALEADLHELAVEGRRVSPHPAALANFLFSHDDIRFQTDLALVGPFNEDGGELWDPSSDDWDALRRLPASSARILRRISPGRRHEFAEVRHEPSGRQYWITGNSHIFGHAGCFDVLRDVLRLRLGVGDDAWVSAFWATVRKANFGNTAANGIDSVDYGREVERTKHIHVVPLANILVSHGGVPETLVSALESDVPHDEAHRDYWLGSGQMWIFVRPSEFPVQQAQASTFELGHFPPAQTLRRAHASPLESLPVELLCETAKYLPSAADVASLFAVSRSLRSKIAPSANVLARHFLPDCWIPESLDPGPSTFPWLRYARECRMNSTSMRNRRRIFDVCEQIARLVTQLTIEDVNGTAVYDKPQFNVALLDLLLFPQPTPIPMLEAAMETDRDDEEPVAGPSEHLFSSAHTACAVV